MVTPSLDGQNVQCETRFFDDSERSVGRPLYRHTWNSSSVHLVAGKTAFNSITYYAVSLMQGRWPAGVMLMTLHLRFRDREFDSRPCCLQVITLGKVFTHICLYHRSVWFGIGYTAGKYTVAFLSTVFNKRKRKKTELLYEESRKYTGRKFRVDSECQTEMCNPPMWQNCHLRLNCCVSIILSVAFCLQLGNERNICCTNRFAAKKDNVRFIIEASRSKVNCSRPRRSLTNSQRLYNTHVSSTYRQAEKTIFQISWKEGPMPCIIV